MVDLVHCLTISSSFDITLFYYYINLNSFVGCSRSSGDMSLSFGISVSLSTVSEVFCELFVALTAILLPMKLLASFFHCFLNYSF